jgi:alanyl-tRNA synthetase
MTTRLYFEDPRLLGFSATVIGHAMYEGAPSVVLDRSAFYPESGGQMADRGTLGGANVIDVQIDDQLVVHHRVDGALPPLGTSIEGRVDGPRRLAHMALHSAQHLLSRALLEVAAGETLSSRLGESVCTIDVDVAHLTETRLAEAEAWVNRCVDDDVIVRAYFPAPEELAALPLRRAPKQASGIRVVAFGALDVSPCGGTHVTHTSQIGLFRVTGSERYKGGTRVTFSAGSRARTEVNAEFAALGRAAAQVSLPRTEIDVGIERLKTRLKTEQERAGVLRAALAEALASSVMEDAQGRVFIDVGDGGVDLAKQVASTLTRDPSRTAIVRASIESGAHLIVSRGATASVDCGALLRRLATAAGGKGGGRVEHAEGKLPAGFDVAAALAE